MSEHPPLGLWNQVIRRMPGERRNRHPLRVNLRGIGPELTNQLLPIGLPLQFLQQSFYERHE